MKTLLVGINSKYIHPNLAIRYLQANAPLPVNIKEFTIKDSIYDIYNTIMDDKPEVLGFSVYIWNVDLVKALLEKLKTISQRPIIILGGPEVSFLSEHFLLEGLVDYIIYNEGEVAFGQLLQSLKDGAPVDQIGHLLYVKNDQIHRTNADEIMNLDQLKSPYDVTPYDYRHMITYIELSRGCPFHCAYCLASLESRVRFFDIQRVKSDLVTLYNRGARTFKFLDRTFNLRESLAIDLFDFIFDNEFKDAVFQFEINADILSDALIDHLNQRCPKDKIRFEIGIQSLSNRVNDAVDRRQDTQRLIYNILRLKQGNVILHLDLIAGLPHETLESFKDTFDTVYRLYGDELQLGFLKLLKGTKLEREKGKFGYDVRHEAPYEIKRSDTMSSEDVDVIKRVEAMLNIYWNKHFMSDSIINITKGVSSPFDFFDALGTHFLLEGIKPHRYQLSDIFMLLESFVKTPAWIDLIRYDYLKYHQIKPKIYWSNRVKKNALIRAFHERYPHYRIDDLYKYGVVTRYKQGYLLVIYFPTGKEMFEIKA